MKRPMGNQSSILIFGASVAGLTLAHWLLRYGFNVTVVEKSAHLRPGGQALDIRGPALDVVKRMGLHDKIFALRTKLTGMSVVDFAGQEIFRRTERTLTGGHSDSADIEILRDDLCRTLYDSVSDAAEFIFNDSVTQIREDGEGVDVEFANASARRYDIVVGADGLHSGIRRILFGPEAPFIRYLGGYVAVFSIPNFLGLHRWQIFHQVGATMGGVLGLEQSQNLRDYVVLDSPEPLHYDYRDIEFQKKLVAEKARTLGWEFPKILDLMCKSENFYFDALSQVRLSNWSKGRSVLVGDAAACVSAATGQGTTSAMVAAYVLAGQLYRHRETPLEGIASYESEVRNYCEKNQALAQELRLRGSDVSFGEKTSSEDATHPDGIPDYGRMVQPMNLIDYSLK